MTTIEETREQKAYRLLAERGMLEGPPPAGLFSEDDGTTGEVLGEAASVAQAVPEAPERDQADLARVERRKVRNALTKGAEAGFLDQPGEGPEEAPWRDVAAMLDAGIPEPPIPDYGVCSDGVPMFYAGRVNVLYGDPEAAKTMVALALCAERLNAGGTAAFLDLDHNGLREILSRLLALGVPMLAIRERFRYADPEDDEGVLSAVRDLCDEPVEVTVVDSVGELLPVFGASSNSPDEFTRVHQAVMKPLARSGTCVILIDHLAKNSDSRSQGATGTYAKKRIVGGVMLKVAVLDTFARGRGGACILTIDKDRSSGLRERRGGGARPRAAVFRMYPSGDARGWVFLAPREDGPGDVEQDRPEAVVTPEERSILKALKANPGGLGKTALAAACGASSGRKNGEHVAARERLVSALRVHFDPEAKRGRAAGAYSLLESGREVLSETEETAP